MITLVSYINVTNEVFDEMSTEEIQEKCGNALIDGMKKDLINCMTYDSRVRSGYVEIRAEITVM